MLRISYINIFIFQGEIIFRLNGPTSEFMLIDKETLKVFEVAQCSGRSFGHGIPFSDGTHIGHIVPERDVSYAEISTSL